MKTAVTSIALIVLLGGSVACVFDSTTNTTAETAGQKQDAAYASIAKSHGWETEYKRGAEILRSLTDAAKANRKVEIEAFRGEKVAFIGGGAPPGGSNDLLTSGGFYLRVINPQHKDLRPHSACWEVMVRGEVRQVLLDNKIIVIEVVEKVWMILQTG